MVGERVLKVKINFDKRQMKAGKADCRKVFQHALFPSSIEKEQQNWAARFFYIGDHAITFAAASMHFDLACSGAGEDFVQGY